ncbi:DEAD-box ATP-dependent RNA helicase 37 [Coccomyxa sp. Obi]|nr:DEAD-box ATP-dependent RNA helicase 37 [Coccomyxa sp. Obi]
MSAYYGDGADGSPGGYRRRDGFSQGGFGAGPFGVDRPDGTREEAFFDEPANPQSRQERLMVPRPRGGAWGNIYDNDDPFEEGDKRRQEEDSVFAEDNKGASVIDFDAYEHIPVEVTGEDVPNPIFSFNEAALDSKVAANVVRCRYRKPTPVQKYAIPIGLARRDLMACAQTGSGKTAAFCFPIISCILSSENGGETKAFNRKAFPKALIMGPTRELTSQIYEEARKFTYQTGIRPVVCYGGAPSGFQLRELEKGVDILIATPGRLCMFIERGRISLSQIKHLVLDEADRMLDMGFEPQIRNIVESGDMPRPGERQTLMFSATFPKDIQKLAADFMSNYLFLAVGRVGSSTSLIIQHFEEVELRDKEKLLLSLVRAVPGLTLVFMETKRSADRLVDFLIQNNFPATTIHGDLSQEEREYSLAQFRAGKKPILVATELASRGLDIPHVTHVINYDMPPDIDSYVHRIGRTGRAGKKGITTAFFVPGKDGNLAEALIDLLKETGQDVPEFLVEEARVHGPYSAPPSRRSGGGFGGRDFRENFRPRSAGDRPRSANGGFGGDGGYGDSGGGGYGGGGDYGNGGGGGFGGGGGYGGPDGGGGASGSGGGYGGGGHDDDGWGGGGQADDGWGNPADGSQSKSNSAQDKGWA